MRTNDEIKQQRALMLIIAIILIIIANGCSVQNIPVTSDTGHVILYYTKVYENYKIIYYPYNPTSAQIEDNNWLVENIDEDTLYIIREKYRGSWGSSFAAASPSEIYKLKIK